MYKSRHATKKGVQSATVIPFVVHNKKQKGQRMAKKAEVVIPAASKMNHKLKIRIDDLYTFEPLTHAQEEFFQRYREGVTAHMLHGVAGTGKTFVALYKALEEVLDPSTPFEQVVIVRSAVQGRDIGHLPGDEKEKTEVYQDPYVNLCKKLFGRIDAFQRLIEQGHATFMVTSFLRGITIDNAIVIVDEAQNLNWQEISTIMTRIGNHSKILFCGDFRQTDLNKKTDMSGLQKFLSICRRMPSFRDVEFGVDDIVRSDIVKEFIVATMRYEDTEKDATNQRLLAN
jgi:phosphate starvation-inducible protein PhoH